MQVQEQAKVAVASTDMTAIAVTVPIIVILAIGITILALFVYMRNRPKGEIKKVLVDNETNESGSQAASSSGAEGGRVTFSKFKAHFSKPKPSGSAMSNPKGISNPNYDTMDNINVDNMTTGDSQI